MRSSRYPSWVATWSRSPARGTGWGLGGLEGPLCPEPSCDALSRLLPGASRVRVVLGVCIQPRSLEVSTFPECC